MLCCFCRDPEAFAYTIKRSCENKADVVSQDEKESGLRAIGNFGHTFGHVRFCILLCYLCTNTLFFTFPFTKPVFLIVFFWLQAIETCCGYGNWLHGEAVAAGMVLVLFH